jgi:hypothetical protein
MERDALPETTLPLRLPFLVRIVAAIHYTPTIAQVYQP